MRARHGMVLSLWLGLTLALAPPVESKPKLPCWIVEVLGCFKDGADAGNTDSSRVMSYGLGDDCSPPADTPPTCTPACTPCAGDHAVNVFTCQDPCPTDFDGVLNGSKIPLAAGCQICDSTKMTNDYCSKMCLGMGLEYSATQNGNQCFCSHTLPSPNVPDTSPPTVDPANGCAVVCAGNASETCGGSWRNTVSHAYPCPELGTAWGFPFVGVLLGCGFLYVAVGFVYNIRAHALPPKEAFPNQPFWGEASSLVSDGMAFSHMKVMGLVAKARGQDTEGGVKYESIGEGGGASPPKARKQSDASPPKARKQSASANNQAARKKSAPAVKKPVAAGSGSSSDSSGSDSDGAAE